MGSMHFGFSTPLPTCRQGRHQLEAYGRADSVSVSRCPFFWWNVTLVRNQLWRGRPSTELALTHISVIPGHGRAFASVWHAVESVGPSSSSLILAPPLWTMAPVTLVRVGPVGSFHHFTLHSLVLPCLAPYPSNPALGQ